MTDEITITFEEQIAAGDALFGEHLFPSPPDWESLHDSTPDDDEDDESEDAANTFEEQCIAAFTAGFTGR